MRTFRASMSSAIPRHTPRAASGAISFVVLLFCTLPWASGFAQRSPHGTLSVPCEQCHGAESWSVLRSPLPFSHASTGFPLRGQHAVTRCTACHASLAFSGTKNRCNDCHDDVHRGELGKQCDRCHSPASWLVADMVQKHRATRFPLVGAHAAAECQSCHPQERTYGFVGIRTDCIACHSADYAGAKAPDHRAAGFSTDCGQCHSVNALRWGGDFQHSNTAFPLTGAHRAVACTRCHAGANFRGASKDCYVCHAQAFAAATSPRHTGFSTTCISCHTTTAWRPASFDHSRTAFALTGAHVSAPCASCHAGGVYSGTPSTCGNSNCHLSRYAATTNPAHAGAGFGTDCQTCHSTTAWVPATFNHTPWFPISAGSKHPPGRWTVCADCHTVPSNYKVFSCIDCHEHSNKTRVDQQHAGRANYTYTSAGCYSCHPRGS